VPSEIAPHPSRKSPASKAKTKGQSKVPDNLPSRLRRDIKPRVLDVNRVLRHDGRRHTKNWIASFHRGRKERSSRGYSLVRLYSELPRGVHVGAILLGVAVGFSRPPHGRVGKAAVRARLETPNFYSPYYVLGYHTRWAHRSKQEASSNPILASYGCATGTMIQR